MKRAEVAVVGAAETTDMGSIPGLSHLGLNLDAARNALKDAGLKPSDVDGIATAGESPVALAHYLGIEPRWVDGTAVGGCSFMLHVRHAAAAIAAGLANNVLVVHGESGNSRIGSPRPPWPPERGSLAGQFEAPYGAISPPAMFSLPVLRYLNTHGLGREALAHVAVRQRQWAAMNPRALHKAPITVDDVMKARMVVYPFTLLMCCPRTDGGGALLLTRADRARDFPHRPVYILGTGESSESPMISQMRDFNTSRAFRTAGQMAFREAGISHAEVNHLMVYDAFAHLPLYGLEDLGFCEPGTAAAFIAEGNTAPGGKLPMNTNGGGLSYMHSGMYGMYALQESVRQVRGIAPAQVDGLRTSFCLGVGGMFQAAGAIVFSSERTSG
jgi:acetyl-CoA acetyltransferase